MNQPRASRLNQGKARKESRLEQWLPLGSWQRRMVLWLGVPLLALIIITLIVDRVVMPMVTRHGTEFTLPDFTGQELVEARMHLVDLNLSHEVTSEEFAPNVPAGVILNQFPIPGTEVKEGRLIKFVVSLGQKQVKVPNTAGESVRQAMLDLETAGLILGEIAWAFSDTLPERVVVFSYPATGTEVPMGSPVNLMVNRGRASNFTFVPGVSGLTLSEARKRLEDKQLRVGLISYRTDENYLPETVLEQSEPEGTELDIGTEIDLVVSTTE